MLSKHTNRTKSGEQTSVIREQEGIPSAKKPHPGQKSLLITLFAQHDDKSLKDKGSATENKMQDCCQKTNHTVEDGFSWMLHQVTLKLNFKHTS